MSLARRVDALLERSGPVPTLRSRPAVPKLNMHRTAHAAPPEASAQRQCKSKVAIWESKLAADSTDLYHPPLTVTPRPSTRTSTELAQTVDQVLRQLPMPERAAQEVRQRLGSFGVLVALSESESGECGCSSVWVEAGAGLCAHLMAWISFSAFCKHPPSASGLLRRSRLRIKSLEAASWSLSHSDKEQEQWRHRRTLSAHAAVRAELAEAFGDISSSAVGGAPEATSQFTALGAQLQQLQELHGDAGGWGWRGKGKPGLKMSCREVASEELERLWLLGEQGIKAHIAAVLLQLTHEWEVPDGVVSCHSSIEAVLEAEREDISRNIGSEHASLLFGAVFNLRAPRGLLHRDRLTLQNVVSEIPSRTNLDRMCLEGHQRPAPVQCISSSCRIDTKAVHRELQATAFGAIANAIEEAVMALEVATVRECCIWQSSAQVALAEAHDTTTAVSGLYSSDFTPRAFEEVGWQPASEGQFDGWGGQPIQKDPLLSALQRRVQKQLDWFYSWCRNMSVDDLADTGSVMECDGMRLSVVSPQEGAWHASTGAAMGAMVPLVGLAGLGEMERGATASLSQGKMLELRLDSSAAAILPLMPSNRSDNSQAISQQLATVQQQRQGAVMAGRAARKTFNFVGKAVTAASAPVALLFEVLSIATGQYYMHEINDKIDQIEKTLSRQELRQACAAMGTLQACAVLADELKQEFLVFSEIPTDWRVRCNQVLRDVVHGLCIAEAAVGAFLSRVEVFVQIKQPKARLKVLKDMEAEMGSAQQDFSCLLGYSKVLLQLRELQALTDLRSGSERTALSAMRVDDALAGMSSRLALFGKLEELVSAAEGGVSEQSWLQKNIMNRSAGLYARQVASSVNGLHRSVATSGMNERPDGGALRYYLTLGSRGDAVHVRAVSDEECPDVPSLSWR